ncbi:extracellular solute-binding protein [Desulfovibrio sp. OttesenSCG-928-C14]|nr:extracellular solute-binding protein [Desulfovibrio sp. OttesenSCG-928-C14]
MSRQPKKHPGSGELPDLFTTYPKTVLAIGPERLVDWKDYLSKEKLAEFVPSFVMEGEIDGRLVLLPVAKSSSALFINATIFEQFSRETGVRYEDLATWEGMLEASKRYFQWSGGKAFFKYDDWLHYSMINTASLGGEIFKDKKINFQDSTFQKVWGKLAAAAVSGEVCLLDGYATTAMMTGETLCGVESTASILYFQDNVIFPDNTSIPLRLRILPVPCFKEGKRLAIQRGGGLGLVKSTPEKEQAAAVFAEWLTAAENNVPFVMKTGYFPVKDVAYKNFLKQKDLHFQSDKYRELYLAIQKIHTEYEFYVPPFFDSYGEVEKIFSNTQIELFKKYHGNKEILSDTKRMLLELQDLME